MDDTLVEIAKRLSKLASDLETLSWQYAREGKADEYEKVQGILDEATELYLFVYSKCQLLE